jgi:hypothetical protein
MREIEQFPDARKLTKESSFVRLPYPHSVIIVRKHWITSFSLRFRMDAATDALSAMASGVEE